MKTYKYLMEKIASEENIKAAIMNASKKKRNRKDVKDCRILIPIQKGYRKSY